MYETSTIENVAYTCFKQQFHDEMNDAHVYEMKIQFVGSKLLEALFAQFQPSFMSYLLPNMLYATNV
jgi:hypothetical protein